MSGPYQVGGMDFFGWFASGWGVQQGDVQSQQTHMGCLDTEMPAVAVGAATTTATLPESAPAGSNQSKQPDKTKNIRTINNRSVARYRERKKQEKVELEENIKKAERELEQLKIENKELSYMQEAMAKVCDYAQDIVSLMQRTLPVRSPIIVEEPEPGQTDQQLGSVCNVWNNILRTYPASFVRNAVLQGLLVVPSEPLLRYRMKRFNEDDIIALRAGFSTKIRDLLEEWEADPSSRAGVERVLATMFKLQLRSLKLLLEDRCDLLHALFEKVLVPAPPKTDSEMQVLLERLELTQEQVIALNEIHDLHVQRADKIRDTGLAIQEKVGGLLNSGTGLQNCQRDFVQCQVSLMAFLGEVKEHEFLVTEGWMDSAFRACKVLTVVQRARVIVHYYPCIPETVQFLRTVANARGSGCFIEEMTPSKPPSSR